MSVHLHVPLHPPPPLVAHLSQEDLDFLKMAHLLLIFFVFMCHFLWHHVGCVRDL